MKTALNEAGVIIEQGALNWQIFQQNENGEATIALRGRWLTQAAHKTARVMVRLLVENDLQAVTRSLDWSPAETSREGAWSIELRHVPRGGLYRIETTLQLDGSPLEWSQRGDMVHHIGVGDIWVIAGQSNAAGYGKSPVQDGPEMGVHMFHASGEWRLATHPLSDSTGTQYPGNRETSNGSHSPYLAFGRKLKNALGYPIGLIPAAMGGSPLSAWVKSVNGGLFDNMMAYLRDAGGACRGMVWYQGCADTGPDGPSVYAARFAEMVSDFRRALKDARLPVITAQLNRYVAIRPDDPVNEGWDAIREIQRQAARTLDGVYVIGTLDVGLSDGIHNDSAGNMVIGGRLADAALGAVYGRDVKYLHPDLRTARRAGTQAIELVFDNVDARLSYEVRIPSLYPFAVRDEAGIVPVTEWKITGNDKIQLELARPLVGKARVTGAPTACPPSILPFDVCGYRPMLAFTSDIME
jgi:sialate O-acetylesterase